MSETGGPMTGFTPEDPELRALKQKALGEIGANEENRHLFWNMIASAESVAKLLKEGARLNTDQGATAAGPSFADIKKANKMTSIEQLKAVHVTPDTSRDLIDEIFGADE